MPGLYLCLLRLAPNEARSVLALLNELALGEGGPEIAEEVGLLLNVALAQDGGDGPGSLLSVVEGDTTEELLVIRSFVIFGRR